MIQIDNFNSLFKWGNWGSGRKSDLRWSRDEAYLLVKSRVFFLMYDNVLFIGDLGAQWDPCLPKGNISFFYFTILPKANLSAGLEGLSDLLGAVNEWPEVYTSAFPMIWPGARVSLGRERKQFVMCKFNRQSCQLLNSISFLTMLSAPNQSNLYCQHDIIVPPSGAFRNTRSNNVWDQHGFSLVLTLEIMLGLPTPTAESRGRVCQPPRTGPDMWQAGSGRLVLLFALMQLNQLVLDILPLEQQRRKVLGAEDPCCGFCSLFCHHTLRKALWGLQRWLSMQYVYPPTDKTGGTGHRVGT